MNELPKKIKRAAAAVAGAVASDVAGILLTPGSPGAAPPPPPPHPEPAAAETAAHEDGGHEYVPEVETHTVTRGEDGSVEARTGTVWHPESTDGTPVEELPTVEEFEQIDVREDEFGNFVIDATERFVVHNHGHDEVYVDHQHLVVPGDGTPGDTDIDIVQDADIVVHENPDGTISVEHRGSLTYELTPDAPGHGDIEVFQEETVVLDEADTGPPGIEVGISVDEQAKADDPFGEPAGPTIHQTETVGDKARGTTVTTSVTAPAPSLPGPPSPPVVTFGRQPSTVDSVPAPVAVETTTLAASNSLAEHPAPKHSFVTEPKAKHHDAGEVTGARPHPAEEKHPFEPPPRHEPDPKPDARTDPKPDAGHLPDHDRVPDEPPPEAAPPPAPTPEHQAHHDHLEDPEPEPVPEEHPTLDHAHADGGG